MWPLFLMPKFKSADEAIQKTSELRCRYKWKRMAKFFTKAINEAKKLNPAYPELWSKVGEKKSSVINSEHVERDKSLHDLASKAVDKYVDMACRRHNRWPQALATLALDQLGSDQLIRAAIREMYVRSGRDPWNGQKGCIADIDLVAFFTHVRENKIDFLNDSVAAVAEKVRRAYG